MKDILKILMLGALGLFFTACATRSIFEQVRQVSNATKCYSCEAPQGFEAKINGLIYFSDMGLKCCANKRTLDSSVAIKKVYFHRFYDLPEEDKYIINNDNKFYIEMQFNILLYVYLREELKNRGIIVLENDTDSPYVTKIDARINSYKAMVDGRGLYARIISQLHFTDGRMDKVLNFRTFQNVNGFSGYSDLHFYTHLLVKQMANKIASTISAFN